MGKADDDLSIIIVLVSAQIRVTANKEEEHSQGEGCFSPTLECHSVGA